MTEAFRMPRGGCFFWLTKSQRQALIIEFNRFIQQNEKLTKNYYRYIFEGSVDGWSKQGVWFFSTTKKIVAERKRDNVGVKRRRPEGRMKRVKSGGGVF